MFECSICHTRCKIPTILSIAIPNKTKDKGLTVVYDLNQYNICRNCAMQILGDIDDAVQNNSMGTSGSGT